MRWQDGGLYIAPWTVRIVLGTLGLGLAALLVSQMPDTKRYLKFESM